MTEPSCFALSMIVWNAAVSAPPELAAVVPTAAALVALAALVAAAAAVVALAAVVGAAELLWELSPPQAAEISPTVSKTEADAKTDRKERDIANWAPPLMRRRHARLLPERAHRGRQAILASDIYHENTEG